jgi:thiazole synthase
MAAASAGDPWLTIGDRQFCSRLILGIEQYTEVDLIADVLKAGGCDVFITTFDLDQDKPSVLLTDLDDAVDLDRFTWIGTTSFAKGKSDALRTARTLRESMGIDIMKLDVRPSDNLPHNGQTVEAAVELIDDGFAVLPFILPDVAVARELEAMGCCALRVMASPVASGLGIVDTKAMADVIDAVDIPVIVEGGIGTPEQVVQGMNMGATACLVNTAVAKAPSPALMARAMRHAVLAGRYGAGQALPVAS